MAKKLEGAGLRGQVAGETSLCTVGQEEGLAYRGHKIETLAEKGTFEEVAYLLLYGKLPNLSELSDYKSLLKGLRDLPDSLKKVLKEIPTLLARLPQKLGIKSHHRIPEIVLLKIL